MAKQFRKDINYYKLLQVDPEADKLVIKSTYYTILNKLHTHPDKGGDEEKTKLINEAYQVLSSSELRRQYDSFLVELAGQKSIPYSIPEGESLRRIHLRDEHDFFRSRQEPFEGIFSINNAFDRWFQDIFTGASQFHYHSQEWNPPVNIFRDEGNLIIRFEVPGVSWQDLHIEVKNDLLTVSGEKRPAFRERNEYLKVEFQYGEFHRTFQLPVGIVPGKMTAALTDGILELMIPVSSESKSRIIPIT
jgi:HSP20 family protein